MNKRTARRLAISRNAAPMLARFKPTEETLQLLAIGTLPAAILLRYLLGAN